MEPGRVEMGTDGVFKNYERKGYSGHGATGQIKREKEGSWKGIMVKIVDQDPITLNKKSVINFLNTTLPEGERLHRFSSDKTVKDKLARFMEDPKVDEYFKPARMKTSQQKEKLELLNMQYEAEKGDVDQQVILGKRYYSGEDELLGKEKRNNKSYIS